MINEMTANSEATAAACGLMIAAFADALINKGILSRDEVASAFKGALDQIGGAMNQPVRIHGPQSHCQRHAALAREPLKSKLPRKFLP
jgi:hypothetical protein